MQDINLTVTVDQPMPQARDRILDRVDHRLRATGLTRRAASGGVDYRPKFVGLVLVWLIRRLQNEGVTFTFDARGPVTTSGRQAGSATAPTPTPSLPRRSVVTRLV